VETAGVGVQKKQETGKLIGYARVSTDDQDLRMQVAALEKAGCWNIYQEKRSATRHKRPQLELALIDLRPGDVLLVWKFDRLVRNTSDAYKLLERVEKSGCIIRSITEPHLEVKTPIGRFTMGLTALLAQLEVDRTSERTSAGIKALQDAGFMYGAQPKLTARQAATLVRMRKRGATVSSLALKFDISPASVNNYLKRAKARRKR
jgi:DNA invertase Pin-like site-specific DNA recombinase